MDSIVYETQLNIMRGTHHRPTFTILLPWITDYPVLGAGYSFGHVLIVDISMHVVTGNSAAVLPTVGHYSRVAVESGLVHWRQEVIEKYDNGSR